MLYLMVLSVFLEFTHRYGITRSPLRLSHKNAGSINQLLPPCSCHPVILQSLASPPPITVPSYSAIHTLPLLSWRLPVEGDRVTDGHGEGRWTATRENLCSGDPLVTCTQRDQAKMAFSNSINRNPRGPQAHRYIMNMLTFS